jgi:hypothetical protein
MSDKADKLRIEYMALDKLPEAPRNPKLFHHPLTSAEAPASVCQAGEEAPPVAFTVGVCIL